MFCYNCGSAMPDEGLFCPECGAKQVSRQVAAPVHEEPVHEEAPAYKEPYYKTVAAYKEPAYEEAPAYEEPVYEPAPAYEEPAYEPAPAYEEPVYEPAPAYEEPVYEEAPAYEEPIYEPAPAYEEPVYEEAPAYDPNFKSCERCGAAIPLDSRFCPECRARQSGASPMPNFNREANAVLLARTKETAQKLVTPQMKAAYEKHKKWIALGIGGIVAILVILSLVLSMIKPRIDLNEYVTVYSEGFEGYGYAQVEFDRDRFYADYGRDMARIVLKVDENKNSKGLLGKSEDSTELYAEACETFLAECVDAHISNGDMLSTDDVFTLRWICKDATALNKYGVKLVYKDIEHTVKNLQEANTFDPFEGIEVVFEGTAPYGRAYLEGEAVSPAAREMRFNLDKDYELSNGDIVTLTADSYQDNLAQFCIENFGMVPTALTKEITVSGLDSYVAQNAQISAEALQGMLEQAGAVFTARMAKNPQVGESLVTFNYLGNYLLVNKDREMFGGYNNSLYLVFKVQMNNAYANGEQVFNMTTDMYWYINFTDLLVDDTGVVTVDLSSYSLPNQEVYIDSGIPSSNRYRTQTWEYAGYQTLDQMYADLVTTNLEVYNCESTVVPG